MWLPSDERRLLAGINRNIGDVDVNEAFEIEQLAKLIRPWSKYATHILNYQQSAACVSEPDDLDELKGAISRYIADEKRIRKAAKQLKLHGLIQVTDHQQINNVIVLSLTSDGYELGRRYANWFVRSGLCFQEYRNHWLWLIFAFCGGAIISTILHDLFAKATNSG